jgi:thymidylate synthase
MKDWKDLVSRVIATGELRRDRTGVGTLTVFGGSLKFDLRERFPLVQAKETRWKVAFLEMLWFLRGEGNTHWLHEHGSKLWDEWANERGELGPIYGVQWRYWPRKGELGAYDGFDQVRALLRGLRDNPHSRRHIVTAWNVADLDDMGLPPCHWAHQCYVSGGGWLDMQVHQRSWDLALGAPFNIAQYAMLLHLYARAAGLKPRYLHFAYGDAHVYLNHVGAMEEVLKRDYFEDNPQLVILTDNTDIDGYKPSDFEIVGYQPQPFVKLEIAV